MTKTSTPGALSDTQALEEEIVRLQRQLDELNAEHEDLKLLYEATIEHGEAVEDQLAEYNILLTKTQERLEAELRDAGNRATTSIPSCR